MGYFTKEELDAYRAQQSPVATPTPQNKKKKGFWVDQISTATGAIGSVLGGVLGSAGGPVGTGVGVVGGGSVGSGFGEWIENKLTGEQDQFKNVGKEALLGGVLSVGPVRGASIAFHGGKALLSGAGKAGIRAAVEKGATATPIRTALGLGNLGGKLERKGAQLLGSQANLGKKEIRELGAGRTPESVISGLNKRYGIRNIDQIAEVSNNVTGANGVYSELTRNALGNSAGVDLGDIRTVANKLLTEHATNVTPTIRKQILESVKNNAIKANGGAKGSLNPLSNPLDAFDVAKSWERKASELLNKATATTADQEQAKVYKELAKTVTDRLYGAKGVAEGLALARPNAVKAFEQLAKSAPTKQQRLAYEKLAKEAGQLPDARSLRSAQADWVAGVKVNQGVERAQAGAAQALGGQAQGLGKYAQRPLNAVALPLDAATPKVGSALAAAGRGMQGRSLKGLTPLGSGVRVGVGGSLINALNVSPTDQGIDPLAQDAAGQGQVDEMAMQYQMAAPQATPFGYSSQELGQAMGAAMMNGDSEAFKQLKQMYDMTIEAEKSGGGRGLTSQQATLVAKTQTASNALDRLEQLYKQAGGGGLIEGTVAGIQGKLNQNAAARVYNDNIASAARFMGRAMGETGAGSDADAAAFIDKMPRLTDSPETVRMKLAELRQLLQDSRNNLMYYGGGAPDVAETAY